MLHINPGHMNISLPLMNVGFLLSVICCYFFMLFKVPWKAEKPVNQMRRLVCGDVQGLLLKKYFESYNFQRMELV